MRNLLKWTLWILLISVPSMALAIDLTPSATDPSVMYLSYIFGVVNDVLSGSGTQILGKMFGVFNTAVLMLAAVIAVYTTLMAILNTGQDGEFLGKRWNSLFVPVRMLLGVLLIAPTSTGYSWIQVGVMWIVLQGVGTANYVWQEAMAYLNNGGSLFVAANAAAGGHSEAFNTIYNQMPSLAQSVFCLEAMNVAINKLTLDPSYGSHVPAYQMPPTQTPFSTVMSSIGYAIPYNGVAPPPIDMPNYPTTKKPDPASGMPNNTTSPDVNWSFLNGICGQLSFSGGKPSPTSTTGRENVTALALQQALYNLDNDIYVPANNVCGISCDGAGTGQGSSTAANCKATYQYMIMDPSDNCNAPIAYAATTVTDTSYAEAPFPIYMWNSTIPDVYNNALTDATNAFVGLASTFSTQGSALTSLGMNPLDPTSTWMTAGNYFFQLMAFVGGDQSINGATFKVGSSPGVTMAGKTGSLGSGWSHGIPVTNTPYLQACGSGTGGCVTYPTTVPADTVSYIEGIMLPLVADKNMSQSGSTYVVGNFLNAQVNVSGGAPMSEASNVSGEGTEITAGILDIVMWGTTTLLNSVEQLTQIHDANSNPIVVLMSIGNNMINMAFETYLMCITYSTALVLAVSVIPSVTISISVLTMCLGFFGMVAGLMLPMIAAGAMLLFYFPLIPFMIYTFGVIGWIMGVIEGMAAAPIIGIGIMHPEGHDIFGKGEQALMLLLNMFLRPALMVFGLITSIMMVYVSVWLINSGLNNAIEKMLGTSTGFSNLIGQAAIPIVYTVMIINVCEKCFTMIHVLPDKVTRWLSGGYQESLGSDMAGVQDKVKQGAKAGIEAVSSAADKIGAGVAKNVGKGAVGLLQEIKKQEDAAEKLKKGKVT